MAAKEKEIGVPDSGGAAEQKSKGHLFFLKTIRLYDFMHHLRLNVLVETVTGTFDLFRLYDASMACFQDSVYFFKRLRCTEKSFLRLFKVNLFTFIEEAFENYDIEEPAKTQYNVIFSQEFGEQNKLGQGH